MFLTKIGNAFPSLEYLTLTANPCCPISIGDTEYKIVLWKVVGALKKLKHFNHQALSDDDRKHGQNVVDTNNMSSSLRELETEAKMIFIEDRPKRRQEGNKFLLNEHL